MTQYPALAPLFAPMFLAAGANTHWAAILGVVVTAVLVAVTAVLVGITAHQVRLTRQALGLTAKAVELTKDAVAASQKEADATAAAVQEAVRARVDERAPRVVVREVAPHPLIWYPSTVGGSPNPADRGELMMFRVPAQNHEPLFVRVDLQLRNEGVSSAWVTCTPVEFLAPVAGGEARASFVTPGPSINGQSTATNHGRGPRFAVAGEDLGPRVRIELQCPLGTWLASSPVEAEMTLLVTDSHEPGVEDEIEVLLRASPFVMDVNDAGRAVVRQGMPSGPLEPPLVECSVMRSQRRYSWEPSREQGQ